ncbi:MAG: hypothetical protein WCK33_04145 [Phycisphaerae bacterium]|jgi:hypothetical protein
MMLFRLIAVSLVSVACERPAPTAPDVRFEIESVLRDMAAACIAGDADGYLRHVAPEDHEFFNEQKYFANDLRKKPASECSWKIGDLVEREGSATGPLTLEWTMPGAKPRSVTYDARFVRAEDGWRFAGETWERHEGPGVLVLHDPGLDELAARVVQAFGDVRSHVQEGFKLADAPLASRTQKVKLYGSMKHLQASICLSYVDGLSGWNEPGESIKLLTSPRSSVASLRMLLAHEFGHVATFELGPKANSMPWWVLEGVAELSAEQWGRTPEGAVKAWAKAGRLAKWEDITDFETVEGKWRGHVYTQGHHMLGYVSERFGREGRVAWLTSMARGKSIDEAAKEALSMSFSELDAAWRATLPAKDEPAAAAEKGADARPSQPSPANAGR